MAKRIAFGAIAGVLASLMSWVAHRFYWTESGTGHHVTVGDPLALGVLCVSLYFVIRADAGRAGVSRWLPLLRSQAPVVAAAGLVFGAGMLLIAAGRLSRVSVHMGAFGFIGADLVTVVCAAGVCVLVARSRRPG